jgi:hypothetical protein
MGKQWLSDFGEDEDAEDGGAGYINDDCGRVDRAYHSQTLLQLLPTAR